VAVTAVAIPPVRLSEVTDTVLVATPYHTLYVLARPPQEFMAVWMAAARASPLV
jgi:hypothetical protein